MDRKHMKAARSLLSWSQADLARAAGLSTPTISTIEQGRNMPEETEKKIVDAFDRAGVQITGRGVEWKQPAPQRDTNAD
jgi:DNA-binding XRE family transcriptional regulator